MRLRPFNNQILKKVNNFVLRTLSGVIFVAVFVGAILYSQLTFCILFCIITILGANEFYTLVNTRPDVQTNRAVGTVAATYLFISFAAYNTGVTPTSVFIPYLLMVIYLLISELYLCADNPMNNWAYAFAGQLYVALPFALLNIIAFRYDPTVNFSVFEPVFPLAIFIFLWVSDSGAYCVGSLLSKRFPAKLFERISPKKSWVGSIGGCTLVIVAAVIIGYCYPATLSTLEWIGFGLVVCIFGTWGDLVESLIKRQLGLKDSGRFLPGHGGVLDRFDSALIAIPAVVIYLYALESF